MRYFFNTMSALNYQESGDHYKSGYQPVELFSKLHLNAFQANVIKYIQRYKRKNGVQDLKKAKHYCELALELKPKNFTIDLNVEYILDEVLLFLSKNDIHGTFSHYLILDVIYGDYDLAIPKILYLIEEQGEIEMREALKKSTAYKYDTLGDSVRELFLNLRKSFRRRK